ncbi:MAG TPA: GAF domain-containing protein [Elusimicrobiales bacterium]|nr:GAF domain-containing protein [Elusimicrobiales bacterium]
MNRDHFSELYSLFEKLSSAPAGTEDGIWDQMITVCAAAIGSEAATYFEAEEKQKTLTFRRSMGPVGSDIVGMSFGYQGIAGWCAENRKPILVADAGSDPRFTKKVDMLSGFVTKSVMAVPALAGGRLLGVAEFINRAAGGAFGEEDLRLAAMAASLAARDAYVCRLENTVAQLTMKVESTINNLSGGFIGVDLSGKVIFFNPKAQEIFDVGGEYMGKNIISLFQLSPNIVSAIGDVLKLGKTVRRQEFKLSVGGRIKVIGYSSISIKGVDGVASGAGVIFQDITNL